MTKRTIALVCAASVALATPTAAATATVSTSWQVVASPDPGANGAYVSRWFSEVTSASAKAVWAVGNGPNGSMIASWNGSAWKLASIPQPTTYSLRAIDTNGTAVWAVGYSSADALTVLRLTSARWRLSNVGTTPAPPYVTDLSVLSNSDVWVVGSSPAGAMALHWNGRVWSSMPPPMPRGARSDQINRVEQVPGTSQVIAVGFYVSGSSFYPYAAQWTGAHWRVLRTPAGSGVLEGVVVKSPTSAWAVGYANPNAPYSKSLVEHWNGTSWAVVGSPNRTYGNYLLSVDANGANDVWAVGYRATPTGWGTLAMHWNGTRWSLAPTPDPATNFDELLGITHVPGTRTFWAVGSKGPGRPGALGENTLTERCTNC